LFWLTTSFPFFLNTWEEYYTRELNLPIINGVSEGTVIACISMIMSGELGREFWIQDVEIIGNIYKLNHITVILLFLSGSFFAIISLINVLREFRGKLSDAMQNLLIFFFLVSTLFIVIIYGESKIVKEHPKIINIMYGFSFAKLVGHLQLAHLSNALFMQYRRSLLSTFTVLGGTTILKTFYAIHLIDIDILILLTLLIHIIGKLIFL
jgi:ethanolaminephosphotransferase